MLVSLFICPICQSPLLPSADNWRCDGSLNAKSTAHSFDVARQGYVNLLPVQQKKSKEPGDSQHSILARQRFLQAGHYQPLQTLIIERIKELLDKKYAKPVATPQTDISVHWLDIGCGEGYYTEAIAQIQGIDKLIAADISKPAVLEVAKASKAIKRLWFQTAAQKDSDSKNHHAQISDDQALANQALEVQTTAAMYPLVTSAAHLPLSANSLTGISSIFSPILPAAFATLIQDHGYLMIAKPDVGHVASVREALFDDVREHDSEKFLTELAPWFELVETRQVSTELSLSASALADLLTMTPYAYRAKRDKRQALLAIAETQNFMTQARFVVYILQKKPL